MNESERESIEVYLAAREAAYGLMHRAFGSEPDEEAVRALTCNESKVLLSLIPSDDEQEKVLDRYFEELDRLGRAYEKAPAETVSALRDDYTALFIGPAKLDAPPWESHYRDSEGALLSKYTLSVRRAYGDQGFKVEGSLKSPDDSLAYELDFMKELSKRTLERSGRGEDTRELRDAQASFLKEHLLRWVGLYAQAMAASSRQCIYPYLAQVLWMMLQWDVEGLDQL